MSLQQSLENINEGSIFVCFCLFWWILLICAHADGLLLLPYWTLFLPLWLWKLIVFFGWLVGVYTWARQRRRIIRSSGSSTLLQEDPVMPYIQALSVSTLFSSLICCSEVLLCIHLTMPSLHLSYLTILTPLLLVGLLGVFGFFFVVIDSRSVLSWTRRRRRTGRQRPRTLPGHDNFISPDTASQLVPRPKRVCTFTIELCIAANLLQLLFLIARLDNWIRSKWLVTFIPSFILLGMGVLFCLIGFTVALIRYFTALFIPLEQRRLPVFYYASHILIIFSLCTSICLLSLRLDDMLTAEHMSYSFVGSPILFSLVMYALNAVYLGPGNPWWFGLNRNISLAILEACPTLQLCANTSVHTSDFWKLSTGRQATDNGNGGGGVETSVNRTISESIGRSETDQSHLTSSLRASGNSLLGDNFHQRTVFSIGHVVQPPTCSAIGCAVQCEQAVQPLLRSVLASDSGYEPRPTENVRHPD